MQSIRVFIPGRYLWVTIICVLLFCRVCLAQQVELKSGTDTPYINKLIFKAYSQTNPDSGILLLQLPLKLSLAASYTRGIRNIYNTTAVFYYKKTDYKQSITYFEKELMYGSSPTDSAGDYYNIGNAYQVQGYYDLAATNLYRALDLVNRANNPIAQHYGISIYNCLSGINHTLKQEDEAFRYLTLAEKTARQEKFYPELITILNNKGGHYREIHKNDSAIICFNESQALCEKNGFTQLEGETQEELGETYLDSGLYNKAIDLFRSSMKPGKCGDDCDIIKNYSSYGIAKARYKLKQYKEAKDLLTGTIKTGTALNIRDNLVDEYLLLENICRVTGDYKQALDCSDSVAMLKEALTGAEKVAAINQMEQKYKTAEKDKQISQNLLTISEQKNKIARKNILVLSISGGLLLLLIIAVSIYMRLIYKQRLLEKKNKIEILRAAVEAGDNERTRIARELHDGIGGMLSASMMRFSSMHHESPAVNGTDAYKDAMDILQDMGDEIRKTAHNLMPEVLLKQTLPEAVASFCNAVARGNNSLKMDFQSYGSFDHISQGDKLNLYRIVQELVKNVVSHSGASIVSVQLMQNDDNLVINVEDNGKGFDVNNKKEGLGLHNIQTRVSSMGGRFTLESVPGKGTVVIVELPHLLNEK